jgi:hypothetical protein
MILDNRVPSTHYRFFEEGFSMMVRIGKWWVAAAVRLPRWAEKIVGLPTACLGAGLGDGEGVARDAAREMATELGR